MSNSTWRPKSTRYIFRYEPTSSVAPTSLDSNAKSKLLESLAAWKEQHDTNPRDPLRPKLSMGFVILKDAGPGFVAEISDAEEGDVMHTHLLNTVLLSVAGNAKTFATLDDEPIPVWLGQETFDDTDAVTWARSGMQAVLHERYKMQHTSQEPDALSGFSVAHMPSNYTEVILQSQDVAVFPIDYSRLRAPISTSRDINPDSRYEFTILHSGIPEPGAEPA